jgi:aminoglycoside phosphotransferase (APT) family kinase protein
VNVVKLGLGGFGRADNFNERQTARWTQQYLLCTEDGTGNDRLPNMLQLSQWLKNNAPMHDARIRERHLVHGDYRLDNLIFCADKSLQEVAVAAVLDWELCTLGDPLCDLAGNCLVCLPQTQPPLASAWSCHGSSYAAVLLSVF